MFHVEQAIPKKPDSLKAYSLAEKAEIQEISY